MTSQKAKLCGCSCRSIFSGFIQTMQFIEKQHNLTLKALILYQVISSEGVYCITKEFT